MPEQNNKTPPTLKFTIAAVFAALTLILSIAPLPSIGYVNVVAAMEVIGAIVASTNMLGAAGVSAGAILFNLYKPSELFLQLGFLTMALGSFTITLLMIRRKWIAISLAVILQILFFIAPGNVFVPAWALWDKFLAILLIYPASVLVDKTFKSEINAKLLFPTVLLLAFIGLEVDAMAGNLLFGVYGYELIGVSAEQVAGMYQPFAFAAAEERLAVALVSAFLTTPLVWAVKANPQISWLIVRGR